MSAEDPDEDIDLPSFNRIASNISREIGGEQKVIVDRSGASSTVDARNPFRFEVEILRDLVGVGSITRGIRESPSGTQRRGRSIPLKGRWIQGYLSSQGPDYINNIYKNWLFFTQYLTAFTAQTGTVSEFNRNPGDYDNMFTYIIVLENLELVKRTVLKEVPQSEYDHPVPQQFRKRRFVEVLEDYEGKEELWDNPFRASYPDQFDDFVDPEDARPDEQTEETHPQPVEPEEVEDPEEAEQPDEDRQQDALGGVTQEPPGDSILIDIFPEIEELEAILDNNSDRLIKVAVDEAPPTPKEPEPDGIELARISVLGPWASSGATPGEDALFLFLELEVTSGPRPPQAVVSGFQAEMEDFLRNSDPYPEWFSDPQAGGYIVRAETDENYLGRMAFVMDNAGFDERYFDMREEVFKTNPQA